MTNQISLVIKALLLSRKQKKKRDAKDKKTYLGNVQVVWTNGDNVAAAPRNDQPQQAPQPAAVEEDLPF